MRFVPQSLRAAVAAGFAMWLACRPGPALAQTGSYRVFVTNERSGDVTVIDASSLEAVATIEVGKRPRGIHASPDGRTVYVALSGSPIQGPPRLDANGNPIFDDDDEDEVEADKSADGVGIIDVARMRLTRKLSVGSDPEEFALSRDATKLYVANEDVATASVIDIATGELETIVPVGQEPEGINVTPDGKSLYVACETGGEIFVIDTGRFDVVKRFRVKARPRTVTFASNSPRAFIPSETAGELNIIDYGTHEIERTISLPEGSRPMSVKLSRDEDRIYVSNGRGGTVSVLDGESYALVDTIEVGTRPWGIAVSPDGRLLFAANGPSNDVSVVDLATNEEIARIRAGESPWGVEIVPTTP